MAPMNLQKKPDLSLKMGILLPALLAFGMPACATSTAASNPSAHASTPSEACPTNPAPDRIPFQKAELEIASRSGARSRFQVELADTPDQQSLGLMYRPQIPTGTGMLFRYQEPHEMAIWMKNTCASLDILFFDAQGVLRSISRNAVPFSLASHPSPGKILWVLELGAGEAARLKLETGARARLISKTET